MKLITPVNIPANKGWIDHRQSVLLMGSCFADEIGRKMRDDWFDCVVNPFGVLYNPKSIQFSLERMLEGNPFHRDDLFESQGLWHSPYHHGSYSHRSCETALSQINAHLLRGHDRLNELDLLIITWGTNRCYVYEGKVVGNCHKMPEKNFQVEDLKVGKIVDDYSRLLNSLFALRPHLKVILTVSPIRYVKYGLHESQLSKAALLMAADELKKKYPDHVVYFPAYEILMDELRDYRYYADDLVHPSSLAIQYVYERFMDSFMTEEALAVCAECRKVSRDLQHRPLHPGSQEQKEFEEKALMRRQELLNKYPYLTTRDYAIHH